MRIVLVRPPFYAAFGSEKKIGNIPLGLLYVASSLEKHGHEVIVYDCETLDLSSRIQVGHEKISLHLSKSSDRFGKVMKNPDHPAWKEVKSKILKYKPDMIGFTSFTPSFNFVIYVTKLLKQDNHIPVVLGGPHVTVLPLLSLQQSQADYVIIGEGEETMPRLVDWFDLGKGSIDDIPGVAYEQTITGDPQRIQNLDEIPFPARHLLDRDNYTSDAFGYIVTSRGCPYNCLFCASRTLWGRHETFRSIKNVVEELEEVQAVYHPQNFRFVDDLFTVSTQRIKKFSEELRNRKLKIQFRCESRVDTINKESVKLLKRAGCTRLCFGIESGSQEILNKIRKETSLNQARYAVKITKEAEIKVTIYVILGHPTETLQQIYKTKKFIKELNADRVTLNMLTPLPGSDLMKMIPNMPLDWTRYYFQGKTLKSMSTLSDEELNEVYAEFSDWVAKRNND